MNYEHPKFEHAYHIDYKKEDFLEVKKPDREAQITKERSWKKKEKMNNWLFKK